MDREPGYVALYRTGKLQRLAKAAHELLRQCQLCPRVCQADRLSGERGKCLTATEAVVASYGPHVGEEAPLVGRQGSGTIFFSHCNLRCVFCQNSSVSQMGEGKKVASNELAGMMLSLQSSGCHNVNLVTPTHVVPQILEALLIAVDKGLSIPLVYNSGGYDSVETLKLLEGVIDIYMPDMKYADPEVSLKYSEVAEYPAVNRAAVKEMHRQVGDLELDSQGVAIRGLLVRHLVMPSGLAGTDEVVHFLAEEISPSTYLNVMDQYRPWHKAFQIPQLSRPVSRQEFVQAVEFARRAGLSRLDRLSHSIARFPFEM
jgi:putative pyruvate formate lyase activating enzyme